MKTSELTQKMVDDAGREFIDRGLIVAAGFAGYKLIFKVPPLSEDAERRAFFAGAQHLFASIMNSALDDSPGESDAEMTRMSNIANELKEFEKVMERTMN